jgi:uncharacterized membrane protein
MSKISHWLARQQKQILMLATLGMATALCLGLLFTRGRLFGRYTNTWLWWNLFLAWLPALAALAAYNLPAWPKLWRSLSLTACGIFWLAFLPNASYLITDVIHFRPMQGVPYWFDLILFIAFAWTGAFLGIVSLLLMQELVRRASGRIVSWVFALAVLALNGFGVYLGRFQRWNSWDVVFNPWPLLADIGVRFLNPTAHLRTYAFTALFGAMFATFYLMIVAVTEWRRTLDEV